MKAQPKTARERFADFKKGKKRISFWLEEDCFYKFETAAKVLDLDLAKLARKLIKSFLHRSAGSL